MTLIYHVGPQDQWCDSREGTQPFVSKADYDALAAELVGHREQLSICEHLQRAHIDRIRELEAEVEALKHDLEKSMANHVADINGSASEREAK